MLFRFTKKNNKKKRMVLLGKSGIISSNLQKHLKKKRINFIALGRSSIDLRNKESFKILKKKIKPGDVVIFISAKAPVKTFEMFIENLKICEVVCDSLKNKKISQLIYISSDAVYSDTKNKIFENSECLPDSLHGQMHLLREKILIHKFKKILCILRPTLIFGVGDTHNGYGPNRFVNLAIKNKNINIFGHGEERRDHIFIEDVVNIIFKCIVNDARGILNLASGKVYSFKHIAKEVISSSNSKSKLKKVKRLGPIPHNGYRPFNIKLLKKNFRDIELSNLKIGIKKYLANIDI